MADIIFAKDHAILRCSLHETAQHAFLTGRLFRKFVQANMPQVLQFDLSLQSPSGWLNAEAPLNMCSMLSTFSTRQSFSGWLNADGKSQNRNDCLDFFLSVARLRLGLGPSKG